jgi:hypothetical protein
MDHVKVACWLALSHVWRTIDWLGLDDDSVRWLYAPPNNKRTLQLHGGMSFPVFELWGQCLTRKRKGSALSYHTPGHGLPTRNSGLAPGRGVYFWARPVLTSAV